jgi:hypothetical protein
MVVRNTIYYLGIPLTSSQFNPLLKAISLVPTMVCVEQYIQGLPEMTLAVGPSSLERVCQEAWPLWF